MKDNSSIIFGLAAALVSGYFFLNNVELRSQLRELETEFKGFREGVIYSR